MEIPSGALQLIHKSEFHHRNELIYLIIMIQLISNDGITFSSNDLIIIWGHLNILLNLKLEARNSILGSKNGNILVNLCKF